MDSIKQLIISGVVDQGKIIRKVAGYNYDLGLIVNKCEKNPDQSNCICIFYGDESTENPSYSSEKNTFLLRIEGHVLRVDENSSDIVEKIIADLWRCFSNPNWRDGQNFEISSLRKTGAGIDGEWPEISQVNMGAFINIEITYKTIAGNPYGQ